MSEAIIYPLDASLLGDNTVYRHCEHIDGMKNYAICLNMIKAFDEGRRKPDDLCSREIKNKTCPALKMRQEEIAAGHALYYVPRVKVEVRPIEEKIYVTPRHITQTDGYKKAYAYAGDVIKGGSAVKAATPRRKIEPVVKFTPAPKAELIDNSSMASVVSQMARDHSAGKLEVKPVVIEQVVEIKEVKPESLVERAKRLREERAAL